MRLSTGCRSIDDLMGGGIPSGKLVLIYGPPNIGKTIFSLQASVMCAMSGKKVIYIDTEECLDEDVLQIFYGWMEDRFGISSKEEKRIEIHGLENVFDLWEFFGMQVTLFQTKAKTTVSILFPKVKRQKPTESSWKDKNWITYAPIYKKLNNGDYGLVVLDSFTSPIKNEISSDQQNWPGRASLERPLLSACRTIAKRTNVPFLMTAHQTKGVMDWRGEPWGGENMVYYVKHIYGLFPLSKKELKKRIAAKYPDIDLSELRILHRYRQQFVKEDWTITWLRKDYGYTDLEGSDVAGA